MTDTAQTGDHSTERDLYAPDAGMEYLAARGGGALAERMGIEFVSFTRELAVARMPVAGNTQPFGLVHGGAYVVLGESLGSMHANWLAGPGRFAVGIDINATHTGSAREGWVTAECRPISVGGTIAVHEIVALNDAGMRCSTIRITNLIRAQR
jgi:1,4-dihydroxy-2-naphthoyl-CoA hydrolase